MKIVIVVPSLMRKGPVIVARDIAQGLIDNGHRVVVFYLDNKIEIAFPCPTYHFRWACFKEFSDATIVHSHSLRPDGLAWFIRKFTNCNAAFVSTIHNYVEKDLSYAHGRFVSVIFSRVWRMFWSGLNACAVLTSDAREYYLKTQPHLRLRVIYNSRPDHVPSAIDKTDDTVIKKLRKRFRIIGASAAVLHRKGFEQIIRALPSLPGHVFLLIGSGPALSELVDLAQELGVMERFVSLGFRANARDYLPSMDIYAMPSHSEGMPLAMLEAVSARVPVICSDIPVFRELFNDEEVVFFALNDKASFVAAVSKAENSLIRIEKAKTRFDQNYSMNALATNYLNFHKDVAQG